MSSSTQSDSCSHENLACWISNHVFGLLDRQQLDSHAEYCVTCYEEQEDKTANHSMNLYEINRSEQESETPQSNDIPDEKGYGHQWTNRDGEYLEGAYNITDRPPSWLFLGKHIFPMLEPDELDAYLALPSWATICSTCHYQINKYMGCLTCHINYRNTRYLYWIS